MATTRKPQAGLCIICGWKPAYKTRRCSSCYMHLRRYGVERPEELIVREGRRVAEARAVLEAHGPAVATYLAAQKNR